MFDPIELGIEFFEGLTAIDRAIVERAAAESAATAGAPSIAATTRASRAEDLWLRGPSPSYADSASAAAATVAVTVPR